MKYNNDYIGDNPNVENTQVPLEEIYTYTFVTWDSLMPEFIENRVSRDVPPVALRERSSVEIKKLQKHPFFRGVK